MKYYLTAAATLLTLSVASTSFSQSLSGGTGSNGGGTPIGTTSGGGANSVTGAGDAGSVGAARTGSATPVSAIVSNTNLNYGNGGGGGGAGVTGGAGGAGGSARAGGYSGLGGAGGATAGADGERGRNNYYNNGGGGGGGGGAAGVVVNTTTTIQGVDIKGGNGGSGGYSAVGNKGATLPGGAGGGGAGGYGAIVNNGVTLTNQTSISGGTGGNGGGGFTGGQGGSGGVGVQLNGVSNLVNTSTIAGGQGGGGGPVILGAYAMNSFNDPFGKSAPGVYVAVGSTASISNTGTITGGIGYQTNASGIQNAGAISTLNNSQAGLTYTGVLPTNYNIITNGINSFGTLSATSVTGSTTFGINPSSTLVVGTYLTVLDGLNAGNLVGGLTGTSGTYTYSLGLRQGSLTAWDLVVRSISSRDSSADATVATVAATAVNAAVGATTTTGTPVTLTVVPVANKMEVSGGAVSISANSVVSGVNAVSNTGYTESITNNGVVSGSTYGVVNGADSTIGTLTNTGVISGGAAGIANLSLNTIDLLVNTGTIIGGIDNAQGRIITLQNSQGGAIPLVLSGNLPNNYQVIINGLASYGQLAVTNAAGQMRFGIAEGSVVYSGLTYTSVLSGVSANNILNTAGSSGGYLFKLTPETSGTIWNLTVGASVVDTQFSLQSTTTALQSQYSLQANGVIAGLTYDCNLFGANGICVSVGGRQTGNANFIHGTTSALIIGGYRINKSIRVGGYLDQNLSASTPNGIISNNNSTPMGGLFAVWNDREDGLGTEVKVSLGYNNKGMTITRPVVGSSEAGSGSTALTSQGANVVAKYNFGVTNRITVSPYVGARYLSTIMNGYSEGQASNVLVPLSYSSLAMSATTALAGVGASHRLDEAITLSISAGAEADMQTTNGSYTVTNVNGLTPVALNPNPNRVRPTATAAAYYKLHKDAQIGLSVLYRQDSMTGMSSTTGMVTYTMGM